MKLTCQQADLAHALGMASRAISSRATLPILANLLLEAKPGAPGTLTLSGTNLEIGIIARMEAEVETGGKLTLPAGLFTEFIKSQPAGTITIEVGEGETKACVTGKLSRASIIGLDAAEYPSIPTADELSAEPFLLDAATLREIVANVAFAAANDESRPALTGVWTQVEEGTLTCVAVDAFRLAKRLVQLTGEAIPQVHFLVPAHSLKELAHILPDDEELTVEVILTERRNQVLFHTSQVDLVSRLVDAAYPPWEQVIPKNSSTCAVVETAELRAAIKSAQLFARESSNILQVQVRPAVEDEKTGHIQIEAVSQDLGDSISVLDATVTGPQVDIRFNVKYVAEVLAAIATEKTTLEVSSPARPGLFKPAGSLEQSYVVMPMYLNKK
jgi:DNA polymerase-3 subunit beta